MGWHWLTRFDYSLHFLRNVLLKATMLFLVLNLVYVVVNPLSTLSTITLYNVIFPGRPRFTYSDDSSKTFSVTLGRLEGLFASHELSGAKKDPDEFRVFLLGDSSVWGWLLDHDETLSACINAENYVADDGRRLVAYNLGYPALSATKDALILEHSLEYSPDAIAWLVTLQTLFDNEQLRHPILQENSDRVINLAHEYHLELNLSLLQDSDDLWARTIVGHRRELGDLLRHEVYGVLWAFSGIDHSHTKFLDTPMLNLPASEGILNRGDIEVGELPDDTVAWDVLSAGITLAQNRQIPVLVVNEPIFISDGLNSDLRYNEYYPRWAYDLYREQLISTAVEQSWHFLDLWDFVPAANFTDTPFHYDADATCNVAKMLLPKIVELAG